MSDVSARRNKFPTAGSALTVQLPLNRSLGTATFAWPVKGKVGSTGGVTSPQLHFEIRKNGRAVDPKQYLD